MKLGLLCIAGKIMNLQNYANLSAPKFLLVKKSISRSLFKNEKVVLLEEQFYFHYRNQVGQA